MSLERGSAVDAVFVGVIYQSERVCRKCVEAETVSQTDGYTNVWRQKQSVKRMDTQTKYPSLHVHAEGKQHREGGCACKLNPRHSLRQCSTNWATTTQYTTQGESETLCDSIAFATIPGSCLILLVLCCCLCFRIYIRSV